MFPLNILVVGNEVYYPLYEFYGKYFVNEHGTKVYSNHYNRNLITQTKEGYLYVNIMLDGSIRKRFLHRLIAHSLLLPVRDKTIINHKNKIRDDNSIRNLEWVTKYENYHHGVGDTNYKNKFNVGDRLFTESEVVDIYTSGCTRESLKTKYPKLTNRTYHDILHDKTYKDITSNLERVSSKGKATLDKNKSISDSIFFNMWLNDYVGKGFSLRVMENNSAFTAGVIKRRFKVLGLPLRPSGKKAKFKMTLIGKIKINS